MKLRMREYYSFCFGILLSLLAGCSVGDRISISSKEGEKTVLIQPSPVPTFVSPETQVDFKQYSISEVVTAVNDSRLELSSGLKRLHELLEQEKDPLVVQGAKRIAEATLQLLKGEPFENISVVIGLETRDQSHSRKSIKEVLDELIADEELRSEIALGKKSSPQSLSLPLHKDAYFIHAMSVMTISQDSVYEFVQKRINHRLEELFLKNWNEEKMGLTLETYKANLEHTCRERSSEYLPHSITNINYRPTGLYFQEEKIRLLEELKLPARVINEAQAVLTEYSEVAQLYAHSEAPIKALRNEWLLKNFHFLVHASVYDSRNLKGVIQLGSEGKEEIKRYFKIWNRYSQWAGKKIGNRIGLTTRQYMNLIQMAKFQLEEMKSLSVTDPQLRQKQEDLFSTIDELNHTFDVHPRELTLDRVSACLFNLGDTNRTLKLDRIIELTDDRFFQVLAPFWNWLAFSSTGISSLKNFDTRTLSHPLTRMYYYRALFAHQRDMLARGESPQWKYRNFNGSNPDSDLNGELFLDISGKKARKITEPVELGRNVFEHDREAVLKDEIESYAMGFDKRDGNESSSYALDADQRIVLKYLHSLYDVEIIRFILDEDSARQQAEIHNSEKQKVGLRSHLKTILATKVNEALKYRYDRIDSYRPEADVPALVPLEEMFTDSQRRKGRFQGSPVSEEDLNNPVIRWEGDRKIREVQLSDGEFRYWNQKRVNFHSRTNPSYEFKDLDLHLNIAPGIFRADNKVSIQLESGFIHPLALITGSMRYKMKDVGWYYSNMVYDHPGDCDELVPFEIKVTSAVTGKALAANFSSNHAYNVLNENSFVMTDSDDIENTKDFIPGEVGSLIDHSGQPTQGSRRYCLADLEGFRPRRYVSQQGSPRMAIAEADPKPKYFNFYSAEFRKARDRQNL